ncbi:4907_t:CDS:2, partial [Funneliformis geosporum]
LFVRVEQGEWTGVLEKEVKNFDNVLERVLERAPSEDIERIKKLRSFDTGKKLAKRERIGTELEKVNVETLGFDHPICSEVLDIKSEPFTEMLESLCDVFKEPSRNTG